MSPIGDDEAYEFLEIEAASSDSSEDQKIRAVWKAVHKLNNTVQQVAKETRDVKGTSTTAQGREACLALRDKCRADREAEKKEHEKELTNMRTDLIKVSIWVGLLIGISASIASGVMGVVLMVVAKHFGA